MHYIQGVPRDQLVLFNTYLDEIIKENAPVRFIDVYVDSLNLYELGFKIPELKTGNPPYDPALLLRIYIYGYYEKIRSSRKIEKECNRNQEMIWLTCRLAPDFKTIADFRKDNREGIKNVFKNFLELCNKLNLLSLKIVAVDGTKLRAQNGLNEVYDRETIDNVKEEIDQKITEYLKILDKNDKKESKDLELNKEKVDKILKKIKELKKREEKVKFIKQIFEENEDLEKYFATDSTSRFQSDKGQVAPGYNAQIATEEKNKLIIIPDVTNESNDLHQMTPMKENIEVVKKELEINEKTKSLFDAGYNNESEILKNKDDEMIDILVADKKDVERENKKNKKVKKNKAKNKIPAEGFEAVDFKYDTNQDVLICPEGKKLTKTHKIPVEEKSGRKVFEFQCRECNGCKSRDLCTKNKRGRSVKVSANIEEIKAYAEMMRSNENRKLLAKRKEMVEHPFGTIKRNWGFSYFMQRGIEKIKAEFSFICFIYNLKRVLNILPVKELILALQKS
jgi:transposase